MERSCGRMRSLEWGKLKIKRMVEEKGKWIGSERSEITLSNERIEEGETGGLR